MCLFLTNVTFWFLITKCIPTHRINCFFKRSIIISFYLIKLFFQIINTRLPELSGIITLFCCMLILIIDLFIRILVWWRYFSVMSWSLCDIKSISNTWILVGRFTSFSLIELPFFSVDIVRFRDYNLLIDIIFGWIYSWHHCHIV